MRAAFFLTLALTSPCPADTAALAACLQADPFLDPSATQPLCSGPAADPGLAPLDRARAKLQIARAADSLFDDPARDAALTQALALGPDQPEILRLVAWAHHDFHDDDTALQLIDRALALHPDAPGHLARCTILQADHQFRAALPDCDRAVALAPNSAEARQRAAHAYNALTLFDTALILVEPSLTQPDATPDTYLEADTALRGMGQLDRARAVLAQGLTRFPDDPDLLWAADSLN